MGAIENHQQAYNISKLFTNQPKAHTKKNKQALSRKPELNWTRERHRSSKADKSGPGPATLQRPSKLYTKTPDKGGERAIKRQCQGPRHIKASLAFWEKQGWRKNRPEGLETQSTSAR